MISFRFFLVAVVAVFLALAVGISMGSGFLGDVVLGEIGNQLEGVRRTNQDLQEQVTELRAEVANREAFTEAASRFLIDDALVAERVVMVTFDHADDAVVETVRTAVEDADGEIVSILRLTEKLQLEDDADRDELRTVIGARTETIEEMRAELAARLGTLLAGAARLTGQERQAARATERLAGLLDALQDAQFVAIETSDGEPVVPAAARFVIVGGGAEEAPFDVGAFAVEMLPPLDQGGARVLVAETSETRWDLVRAVRADEDASAIAATVDTAESVMGGVAVALGLDRAIQGSIGHYGFSEGASEPIPPHTPED